MKFVQLYNFDVISSYFKKPQVSCSSAGETWDFIVTALDLINYCIVKTRLASSS